METTYKNIHPYFKLNGFSLSKEELREVAYSLIKEGEPFENGMGDFLLDWLTEKDTLSVRTSGSTGTPKKIILKKQQMVNSALATGAFFDLGYTTNALLCLSADYIAGKMMFVRAMTLGWNLDYVAPSSSPLDVATKKYDFVAMVPLQAQNSLQKLHLVKILIVGGAPISLPLRRDLEQVNSVVYETFGMTETISHIALKKIEKGAKETCFTVLPNVTVATDARECLVVHAPEITNQAVVTNDVVRLISENQFEWLGRYDTILNSGGIKLHPEAIEKKLEVVIPVPFFVAGIPDTVLGQKLIVIIEGEADKALLSKLNALKSLEKFEIPKEVYCVPKFALGSNGKLNRKATLDTLFHTKMK
ncbi:AMP-binding protein [Arenibacter sp. GZD96]|uniref:AMP-binding protein n=1 Tax=Aurantibrevibacter litoralis TaxID=3106030 RepID=UPI002AFE1A6C|nr:AMP-binding protein [Arenibacter sp. GZD-96]MEA1786274.1 AMP-binding protein [Arenibacter sp. GZD-96]